MSEETISINGVLYDAKTGQPIKAVPKPAVKPPAKKPAPKKVAVREPRKIVVNAPKKPAHKAAPSRTLNRAYVKRPSVGARAKSASRAKTAPPSPAKATPPPRVAVSPSRITHRGVKRPNAIPVIKPPAPAPKISEKDKKRAKFVSIITGAVVLVAVAGLVCAYFFLPVFNVWVAATRSEVRAVLPVYTPTGYNVQGTAQSSPGVVTINYHAPSLGANYSLTQANSNWNSAGVLENKVKPLGNNFQTLSQKGLTIYRFNTGATWVNGGVLYTIADEGKLSNEQILKIVDSI